MKLFRDKMAALTGRVRPDLEKNDITFKVKVYRDDVDGGWVAECINLPGCVSDGETEHEALTNLIEAMTAVIRTRIGDGLPKIPADDEDQEGRELALVI